MQRPVPQPSPNQQASKPSLPHPLIAIALIVIIFLMATMVLGPLIVSLYGALHHWTLAQTRDWIQNSTAAQFAYTLIAYGLLVLPIIWILKVRGVALSTIGLKRLQWRDPGLAVLAWVVYFIAYIIILAAASALVPSLNVDQKQQIGFEAARGPLELTMTFLSLAVIPPLAEEIAMRGFIFSSLRARYKLSIAVLVTSIIFACAHLQFGSGAPLLWVAALDTFTLSLVLIYLRVKTDSLWASICLHALKNGIAFLTIFILHKG